MTQLRIGYQPAFVRMFKKLSPDVQREVKERIATFAADPHHPSLRVHKLKGKLKEVWSFSVNYQYRIVFEYLHKNTAVMLAVGDHDVYK